MPQIIAPKFYLIGLPKAGTTSVYEMLAQSPQIFDCAVKEPNYFLPDGISPSRICDPDHYQALYHRGNILGQYGLDASVAYSHSTEALKAIMEARPDARFLVILRNPETLAVSQFQQMKYSEYETCETFSEAWQDRISHGAPSDGPYSAIRDYPRSAAVGDILERIKSVVPEQQLMVLIFEELKADTDAALARITSFLGIEPFDATPVHTNSAKEPMFRKLHRQILKQGPLFRATRTMLRAVPFLDTRTLSRFYFEKMVRKPSAQLVSEKLADDLRKFFSPQIRKTEALLGRPIPAWSPENKICSPKVATEANP